MDTRINIAVDQLYRLQPGGIATYVTGLLRGLQELERDDLFLTLTGPAGPRPQSLASFDLPIHHGPLGVRALTKLWAGFPLGVPRDADVVHATSMAGPFGGGKDKAVHSVMVHDLLWRDTPHATTKAGITFHEKRLQSIKSKGDLRVIVSTEVMKERLVADGFAPERVSRVRLGADSDQALSESPDEVAAFLASFNVHGPYVLHAGTREPRKNIERLVRAHDAARRADPSIGELVLVGPDGWGEVATGDATVVGMVSPALLSGLYRDAGLLAFVPLNEGWGLPPVEALQHGTRVVVSTTTPSTVENSEVIHVNPLDEESITHGILEAWRQPESESASAARRASVADLTWRNCAADHLEVWL